jgi:hypothetical protein
MEKKDKELDFGKYKYDMDTQLKHRLNEKNSKDKDLSSLLKTIKERLKYHGEIGKSNGTGVKSRIFLNELKNQSVEKVKCNVLRKIIGYFDDLFSNIMDKYMKLPNRHK